MKYLKQVTEIREKQVEQMQQTIDLLKKMSDKEHRSIDN